MKFLPVKPAAILSILIVISMILLCSCDSESGEYLLSTNNNDTTRTVNTGENTNTGTGGSSSVLTPPTTTESGNGTITTDKSDTQSGPETPTTDTATSGNAPEPITTEGTTNSDHVTEPVTEPVTQPVTEPETKPVTEPDTGTATEPVTADPDTGSKKQTVNSSLDGKNYTLTLNAVSGSFGASLSGDILTVTFNEKTEISLSGSFAGGILFKGSSSADLQIDLDGCTVINKSNNPALYIESASDCALSAKSGSENFIYDKGEQREELSSAIYCACDLKLKGSGKLTVESDNNNGIHSKDDLSAQKLTLTVNSADNSLKGNDSVSIASGTYTLISRSGDGVKTSSTDLSSKNVQRGTVTISGGNITIYAACDGIDAAYDVSISGDPVINIYTDKYSEYSEEVTTVSENIYYIRNSSNAYKYSICYVFSDGSMKWVNSSDFETVKSGRSTYYYYKMAKESDASGMILYIYSSAQVQGQSEDYYLVSSQITLNDSFDTIALSSRNGQTTYSWTNYTTAPSGGGPGGWGGPGGMDQGNTDKGDYSTKGIKSGNAITVLSGTVNIKAYDDALHANSDNALESGAVPSGDITVSGGTLILYTNDDGIHADGTLTVDGGIVTVSNSYEGIEANVINIKGGSTYVTAKDDGVNATAGKSTTAINVSGGYLDVTVSPSGDTDGIDSNGSYTQTGGIVITRGPNQSMSAALDTDRGATISGGTLIVLGYSNVKTSGSVKSYYLSLNSSGSHTIKIDGVNYTINNSYSYGRTTIYSSVNVTG